MRKFLLATFVIAVFACKLVSQTISLPPSGDNQKASVSQNIGSIVKVTVNYSSPDVHGPNGQDRTGKIWGTLIPYGLTDLGFGLGEPAPWRAGANENTTIQFSHDVLVEGKPLSAGTYGLHLIVQETGPWTWIFSKNNTAWGSYFYTAKDDALRVEVTPKENPYTEWLTYTFTDRKPDAAILELQWEKKAIPMHITVPNINDLYIAQFDRELQGMAGFDSRGYIQAANFLLQKNYNLEKALVYANQASANTGETNFETVTTKSNVLLKMGKKDEARQSFTAALALPDASPGAVHQLGRNLLNQGEKELAMEVFQMNYDKNKGAWPTNVGMTRGLAAMGKYDEALKYAQAALAQAPDEGNKKSLQGIIERLKGRQDIN